MIKRICKHCSKGFEIDKSYYEYNVFKRKRKNVGIFCSLECRKSYSHEKRNCKECNKEFLFKKSYQKKGRENRGQFCSRDCFDKSKNGKSKSLCIICNKEFEHFISQKRKYCSLDCSGNALNSVEKECVTCGEIFIVNNFRRDSAICCSVSCRNKWQSETRIKLELDAKTRFNKKSWQRIRKKIIERDNYECQLCKTKENLSVHHIVKWRVSKDDSPNNLITLCRKCHFHVDFIEPDLLKKIKI